MLSSIRRIERCICLNVQRCLNTVHLDGTNGYCEADIENTLQRLPGGNIVLHKDQTNATAFLQIRNASKRNAFTGSMMLKLRNAVKELSDWHEGKAVVVYGAENMFCAGSDIAAIRAFTKPEDGKKLCMYMQNTMYMLQHVPQITLAYVEGKAVGGGAEVITACDFRLMSNDAEVQFVQKKMGLVPGWGGVSRLIPLVGKQTLTKWLLTGATISAREAVDSNLADDIVPARDDNCLYPETTASNSNLCPALHWANAKFDLFNSDAKVLQSIKLDVVQSSNKLGIKESLKSEIEFITSLWGGPANQRALRKSRHGRSQDVCKKLKN